MNKISSLLQSYVKPDILSKECDIYIAFEITNFGGKYLRKSMEENMKKLFAMLFVTLLVVTLFTGCGKPGNYVSINTKTIRFGTYDELEEYTKNIDTSKYMILTDYESKIRSTIFYNLVLIKKAKNENYEVFQFSDESMLKEYEQRVDSTKKVYYYYINNFCYLIVVSENTNKSPIAVKEILQNDENYIVIAEDDNLLMVPKNIAEFAISNENNILNFETTDGKVTKAIFCITKEMQDTIN